MADTSKADSALGRARVVLGSRKTASMLALGFASGLPFVLLVGTLNAWLGAAGVDLATIGILSWIGLAYAFKFLWSPVVNMPPPVFAFLGRRRGWMALCQIIISAAIAVIALNDPATGLGAVTLAAAAAAFASATQDMTIDAWRIEAAGDDAPLDLMSAVYQFGYRTAALAGGAGALLLADVTSWNNVYLMAAGVMALSLFATWAAPEPAATLAAASHALPPDARTRRTRNMVVYLILTAWAASAAVIIIFMVLTLTSATPPKASDFTQYAGPTIVAATVLLPCLLAAWIAARPDLRDPAPGPGFTGRLYGAIVTPFAELMARLGWAAILVMVLILTYRLTDSIWGPFAFPFYLNEMHYTNTEVALASKTFGVIMTIAGIALAAVLLVWLGRMVCLTLGAIVAAATNLLYADLASGAPGIDAFLNATGLSSAFGTVGLDMRMGRLMTAITAENIAAGFAGAAFVAYLSSLASKLHGAVQFAVFTSLTLLVGTLGRGALGEMIKTDGYPAVFIMTALLGIIAVIACILEWIRMARIERREAAQGAQAA